MKGFIEIHTTDGKPHLVNIKHIVEVVGNVIFTDDIAPQATDFPNFESLKLINSTYGTETKRVRDIAIQEFVEKLKKNKYLSSDWSHGEHPYVVEETDIDNLVKEMTEEQK